MGDGLTFDAVSAGYGSRPALRDVTLAVAPGEIVGLVGPNGSGKTTAIRVASRSLRPTSGHVRIRGTDPYAGSARTAAQLVAVVPQEVVATFEFTAREVVLMGRTPYLTTLGGGTQHDHRSVQEAMRIAGIEHLAQRPLNELSGGEKQRVILAQALAQDAPILLFDEPTTHLDLRHVVAVLEALRDLAEQGRAILCVFHDLNLASGSCDRLVVLESGRVVASGPPQSVVTQDLLRDIYGVEAEVAPHPATGRPTVFVTPGMAAPAGDRMGSAVREAR